MDIYQLDYILHEPEESEGWMYLAEVPALQGCMACGELTPRNGLTDAPRRLLAGRSSDVMSFSTQALTPISATKKGLPAIHATSVPATPCPEFHRVSGAPSSPGACRTVAARTRRPPP